MTLVELREQIASETGHFEIVVDFVNDDFDDNGCNALIYEAQRWLDRLLPRPLEEKYLDVDLDSGEYEAPIEGARYVTRVEMIDSDGGSTLLTLKPLDWIIQQYGENVAEIDSGEPLYWFVQPADSEAGTEVFDEINVVIVPPTEEAITLRVYFTAYATTLTDDTDESWWSVNEPEILCDAVRMVIERKLHRNVSGARDFEVDIRSRVNEIYNDLCAQEIAGPPENFRMGA